MRIVAALSGKTVRPCMPYSGEEFEARGLHAAKVLLRDVKPVNKRDVKKLEKEKEIVRLHQVEGLQPAEIAKVMKVSA